MPASTLRPLPSVPGLTLRLSAEDVSWLNAEAAYRTNLQGVVRDAADAAAELKNWTHPSTPSFLDPAKVLQGIADAATPARLGNDAAKLQAIASGMTALIADQAEQAQRIADLEASSKTTGGASPSGSSNGKWIALAAAVAAAGAGAWWYTQKRPRRRR
jgi:hypothetical protein